MNDFAEQNLQSLSGSTVLVTGATGLIGKALVRRFLAWNRSHPECAIRVLANVRSTEKAVAAFGPETEQLAFLTGDIRALEVDGLNIHYVVHTASATASEAFVKEPVEVISTALDGTRNLLRSLTGHGELKKFVLLSTMEVYGTPTDDEKIDENHGTNLNTMSTRSCYPIAKRMCENLCACYWSEYRLPACVIRLTQTFGPGVAYHDGRVFAQFARCAIEHRDIVLATKGETKRSYLYLEDAVSAILAVLCHGAPCEAYNAANESTYCSIYEMARLVADDLCGGDIRVQIQETDSPQYAPTLHMNLDTTKLRALGWEPTLGLREMFRLLIDDMRR